MVSATTSLLFLLLSAATAAPAALAQRGESDYRRALRLDHPDQAPSIAAAQARLGRNGAQPPAAGRAARPAILLTGYWPPSNEAVRKFSPDPQQNPGGWQGADWEGRGYDVYSYFPEFTPPNCNSCGKGDGDLEVDYQDTSADFWPIAWNIQPVAIITFSRGFDDHSWELEMNQYNRTFWWPDYLDPKMPDELPPDDSRLAGALINSSLPVQDIVDAVNQAAIGANAFVCWSGNGGGFLSEFIAYHGVWYREDHPSPADPEWCVAAGHVHVGGQLSWQVAEQAADISLRTLMGYVDTVVAGTVCQPDLGYGGPGSARLAVCGDALSSGGEADLMVVDGAPGRFGVLLGSTSFQPTPWNGGTVVPLPVGGYHGFHFDDDGRWAPPPLRGGGYGTLSVYSQVVYLDPAQPLGFGFSNALRVDYLP